MTKKQAPDCLITPMIAGKGEQKDRQEEFSRRWRAALEYYDIDPDAPEQEKKLLWALLQERWAGFRLRRRGGAKRKHSYHDMMWIEMDFHRIKSERSSAKDETILREMAQDPFYQEQGLSFEALRGVHKRSRQPKNAREILRAADKFMETFLEVGGRFWLSAEEVAEVEQLILKRK